MATLGLQMSAIRRGDERFFLGAAIAMTVVIIAGFSLNIATGRSTFASPLLVHAHAAVFMGWVAIYLAQNILVSSGRTALHKRLGWLAAAWIPPMLVLGFAVTIAMVRRGQVPFFFQPLQFLIFDPVSLLTFAGLATAAIALRRRTDWHRRLMFCGMTMLVGPGIGRLLPMPLLTPWAWEVIFAATLIFPLAGVWQDLKRQRRVHRAWIWGVGTMLSAALVTEAITYSSVGLLLYRQATDGSPGANVAPLAFPAAPPN